MCILSLMTPPRPKRKLLNLGLPQGVMLTASGHLRYTSPRGLRGEYVHRKIIKDRIDETPYSIRLLLPWPYEVHHVDYVKTHNCSCNLMILSNGFHSALTAHRFKLFQPKWTNPPEWALFDNTLETVPF